MIKISIRKEKNLWIVRCKELAIYCYNEKKEDAIKGLCQDIIDLIDDFKVFKDKKLGKLPKQWKAILFDKE